MAFQFQFDAAKHVRSLERAIVVSLGLIATNILVTEGYNSLFKSTLALYSKFPGFAYLKNRLLPSADTHISIAVPAEVDEFTSRPLKRYVSGKDLSNLSTKNEFRCELFMRTKVPYLREFIEC